MAHKYYQGRFKPRNPEKYTGNVNEIIYRSSWEVRVMKYLDENSAILKWCSEEIVVPYISPLDGRQHRYFPDFAVQLKTKNGIKTMLWEVKPAAQSIPPETQKKVTRKYVTEVARYGVNMAKWEAAKRYCDSRGWEFLVLTENDLFGTVAK